MNVLTRNSNVHIEISHSVSSQERAFVLTFRGGVRCVIHVIMPCHVDMHVQCHVDMHVQCHVDTPM